MFSPETYGAIKKWVKIFIGLTGIKVGTVTNGDVFPTVRPSGNPLMPDDYVLPASTSDFPFTIDNVTFTAENDKAFWTGSVWTIQAGVVIETNEVVVKSPSTESISETAIYQKKINEENAPQIKKIIQSVTFDVLAKKIKLNKLDGTYYELSLLDTATELAYDFATSNSIWKEKLKSSECKFELDTSDTTKDKLHLKLVNNNGDIISDKTINFDDLLVLANKVQTITNKTIKAEDNTIQNLTGANLKPQAEADKKKTWVWNGTAWVLGKAGTDVDELTIEVYEDKLQIKGNIETKHLKTGVLRTSTTGYQDVPDDEHLVSEKLSKDYIDDEIAKVKGSAFRVVGTISTTQPTTSKVGYLWFNSSVKGKPSTEFPWNVKKYDGTNWQDTTYTATDFETWANANDDHGYYYFNSSWNLLDAGETLVDGTSIDRNTSQQLEIKNSGVTTNKYADNSITFEKFNSDTITRNILENPENTRIPDANAVYMYGKLDEITLDRNDDGIYVNENSLETKHLKELENTTTGKTYVWNKETNKWEIDFPKAKVDDETIEYDTNNKLHCKIEGTYIITAGTESSYSPSYADIKTAFTKHSLLIFNKNNDWYYFKELTIDPELIETMTFVNANGKQIKIKSNTVVYTERDTRHLNMLEDVNDKSDLSVLTGVEPYDCHFVKKENNHYYYIGNKWRAFYTQDEYCTVSDEATEYLTINELATEYMEVKE